MQQFHKSIYLTFMCHSTCFRRLHAHHQELTTALTASGFTLERGGSSIVGRGLDQNQQRCYHHAPTIKPEAVNAVLSSWWWAWRHPKHIERHINVKQ
jgi:hypothetical protein